MSPVKPKNVYPRHAKAFAKPIRLSPLGAKQVGITPRVKKYVEGFQAKGLKGIGLAKAIVTDVANFQRVALTTKTVQKLWARRSVNDVLRTKKVYIGKFEKNVTGRDRGVIMGCTDMTIAVTSSLRAAGFKVLVTREFLHTYAKVYYKGKIYIADAQDAKRNQFRPMTPADKRRENSCKRKNAFSEGSSLADIGLKSYKNFFKYWRIQP